MAFQQVPDTAEAVVRWTQNSQLCTNTFYGRKPLGYDQTDIDALAAAVDEWWGTRILPRLSQQLTYNSTEVRGLDVINDLFASANAEAGVGGIVSNPLPNSLSLAIKRVTGFTGRSARGRVYIPFTVSELQADENFLITANVNEMVSRLNELRTFMIAEGWTEVLVSRYAEGVKRPVGVTTAITGYEVTDYELDTQRRRMPSK